MISTEIELDAVSSQDKDLVEMLRPLQQPGVELRDRARVDAALFSCHGAFLVHRQHQLLQADR
ncbi:MAG TPA: hypothetical protein VLA19_31815, partial [Herpetosiphonaceae bacterium]|nr:hypothetical protein [Herpetosiphonaceae bacterium]